MLPAGLTCCLSICLQLSSDHVDVQLARFARFQPGFAQRCSPFKAGEVRVSWWAWYDNNWHYNLLSLILLLIIYYYSHYYYYYYYNSFLSLLKDSCLRSCVPYVFSGLVHDKEVDQFVTWCLPWSARMIRARQGEFWEFQKASLFLD